MSKYAEHCSTVIDDKCKYSRLCNQNNNNNHNTYHQNDGDNDKYHNFNDKCKNKSPKGSNDSHNQNQYRNSSTHKSSSNYHYDDLSSVEILQNDNSSKSNERSLESIEHRLSQYSIRGDNTIQNNQSAKHKNKKCKRSDKEENDDSDDDIKEESVTNNPETSDLSESSQDNRVHSHQIQQETETETNVKNQ